jgi:hypothetical protein
MDLEMCRRPGGGVDPETPKRSSDNSNKVATLRWGGTSSHRDGVGWMSTWCWSSSVGIDRRGDELRRRYVLFDGDIRITRKNRTG